jgi:hypothetical protein
MDEITFCALSGKKNLQAPAQLLLRYFLIKKAGQLFFCPANNHRDFFI